MLRTNTKKQNAVHLVGVAKIEIEPNEDVYNMEVMGTHNFAVNGGVIVHNCMDDIRYFVNTVLRHKSGNNNNTFWKEWYPANHTTNKSRLVKTSSLGANLLQTQ